MLFLLECTGVAPAAAVVACHEQPAQRGSCPHVVVAYSRCHQALNDTPSLLSFGQVAMAWRIRKSNLAALGVAFAAVVVCMVATWVVIDVVIWRDLHELDELWELHTKSAFAAGRTGIDLQLKALGIVASAFVGRLGAEPVESAELVKVFEATANMGLSSGLVASISLQPMVLNSERAAFEAAVNHSILMPPRAPAPLTTNTPFPLNYSDVYFPLTQVHPIPPGMPIEQVQYVDLRNRTDVRYDAVAAAIANNEVRAVAPFSTPLLPGWILIPFYQPVPSVVPGRLVDGYITLWVRSLGVQQLFPLETVDGQLDLRIVDVSDAAAPVPVVEVHNSDGCASRHEGTTEMAVAGRTWEVSMGVSECHFESMLSEWSTSMTVLLGGGLSAVVAAFAAYGAYALRQRAAQSKMRSRLAETIQQAHTRLLRVMNHELRNPLTVVRAGIEMVQTQIDDGASSTGSDRSLAGEGVEVLSCAMRAVDSMQRSLDDLLDVQMVHENIVSPRLNFVEIDALMRDVRHYTNSMLAGTNHALRVLVSDDCPPTVLLDYSRTRQLLVDLIYHSHDLGQGADITIRAEPVNKKFLVWTIGPLTTEVYTRFAFYEREADKATKAGLVAEVCGSGWVPRVVKQTVVTAGMHLQFTGRDRSRSIPDTESANFAREQMAVVGMMDPAVCQRLALGLSGTTFVSTCDSGAETVVLVLPLDIPSEAEASFNETPFMEEASSGPEAAGAPSPDAHSSGIEETKVAAIDMGAEDWTPSPSPPVRRPSLNPQQSARSLATSVDTTQAVQVQIAATPKLRSPPQDAAAAAAAAAAEAEAAEATAAAAVVTAAKAAAAKAAASSSGASSTETSTGGPPDRASPSSSPFSHEPHPVTTTHRDATHPDAAAGTTGAVDESLAPPGVVDEAAATGAVLAPPRSGRLPPVITGPKPTSGGKKTRRSRRPRGARRDRRASHIGNLLAVSPKALQVIVVDDEPMIRKMVVHQLKRLGVPKIHELQDGDELLPLLDTLPEQPTAVLLDIVMKRTDGVQVLCELRDRPRFKYLPVYAMTSNIESVARYRESGFDGLLGKPFYIEEVVAVINHACNAGPFRGMLSSAQRGRVLSTRHRQAPTPRKELLPTLASLRRMAQARADRFLESSTVMRGARGQTQL